METVNQGKEKSGCGVLCIQAVRNQQHRKAEREEAFRKQGDVMNVEEVIKKTVDETVIRLKYAGLMKDNGKTIFQKTEELLRQYNVFSLSGDPAAEKMILQIENALQSISGDFYYDVIPLYYIQKMTREEIAERFDTSVTTITRNKSRLIKQISAILFSGEYIKQLYS